jgi:hypothetical protein
MSDQNFSGGGIATQEPPTEAPDSPVTGSRRNLIVVAVAVVAAIATAAYFLFLSGGGSPAPVAAVTHASLHPSGASKVTGGTKTPGGSTPIQSAAPRDKSARDPFKALLVEPTAAPSATAAVGASPTATPSGSTSNPAPSSSSSTPGTGTGNVVATVTLKSINAKAKTATFNVDASGVAKNYAGVVVGGTFATFFKLYDLGTKCAQVQYGDQVGSVCLTGGPLVLQS